MNLQGYRARIRLLYIDNPVKCNNLGSSGMIKRMTTKI